MMVNSKSNINSSNSNNNNNKNENIIKLRAHIHNQACHLLKSPNIQIFYLKI